MDAGVYIAAVRLHAARRIAVGRLGAFHFPPGLYFYAGSAQQNLAARLARHARRDKPRRWHLDYLTTDPHAALLGALTVSGPRRLECDLAAALANRYDRPAPGFGASNCRCPAHLYLAGELRDWRAPLRRIANSACGRRQARCALAGPTS